MYRPEFQTDQKEFDERYITSSEIQEELNIQRSTILQARRRGLLPHAITIRGVNTFIWDRKGIRPYLDAWKLMLQTRRANKGASKA